MQGLVSRASVASWAKSLACSNLQQHSTHFTFKGLMPCTDFCGNGMTTLFLASSKAFLAVERVFLFHV